VIDYKNGAVHISAEPGAGKTTLCLGIASEAIKGGGRVVWVCRKMPNQERATEILWDISNKGYERLSILHLSGSLSSELDLILSSTVDFGEGDVIIIDDWCENHGRAKKGDIHAVNTLSGSCEGTNLVITSSAYEDASNASDGGWVSRGGKSIRNSLRTVFLLNHPVKDGVKIVSSNNSERYLKMTSKGLKELIS
tara:strand:+ start:604 stop:1188 length:585 start_codon:yes stop_codon:yes gene_type:complete